MIRFHVIIFLEKYSNTYDGRLNGVVILVTVFEELSYVMSPFWSHNKVKWGNRFFHEQVFGLRKLDG